MMNVFGLRARGIGFTVNVPTPDAPIAEIWVGNHPLDYTVVIDDAMAKLGDVAEMIFATLKAAAPPSP